MIGASSLRLPHHGSGLLPTGSPDGPLLREDPAPVGFLLYAAGLALVAVTPTLLLLLIPLVLFGVARGINLPAVFSS